MRPTQDQYDQALLAYRAGEQPDAIAAVVGLDVAVVETLISEGMPRGRKDAQGARAPALEPFDAVLQRGVIEILNAEIDWAQTNATRAAKTAKIRAESAVTAATLERSLLQVFGAHVTKAMRNASAAAPPALASLCMPKEFSATLKALRVCQDPTVDIRAADIFKFLRLDESPEDSVDAWEKGIRDLVGLSEAELDEYKKTGNKPKPQLDLPLEKAG